MTQVLQREAWKPDTTPTAIYSKNAENTERPSAYRLNGTIAHETARGIIIENGKKSVR
jgi:hypothetical protein